MAGVRSKERRQYILKQRFHFDCECVLCETEKEGPVVIYDELIMARTLLDREKIYTDDHLIKAKSILNEMRKIFCQYDERMTNLYDNTLEKLVVALPGPFACKLTVSEVKKFAQQVKKNLRISFGTDHKDFKYFEEEIAPRLQEAECACCCALKNMRYY